MIHLALHAVVPLAIAFTLYRDDGRRAALVLLATMLVDLDHLLANPVYDPARCSIGFHPLHGLPAVGVYLILAASPLLVRALHRLPGSTTRLVHYAGVGLIIHMLLDGLDCL